MTRWIIAVTGLMLALAGCESKTPPPTPPQQPAPHPPQRAAAPAEPAAPSQPTTGPSADDVAAVKSLIQDQSPAAPAQAPRAPAVRPPAASGAEVKFETPEGWHAEAPRSPMRKAQFTLPRAEGDEEDGELVVFYFGVGEGGGVAENLARWRGQFTTKDGAPVGEDAITTEKFEADGMPVSVMDVTGRFAPGPMPGMPAVGPREDYRMIAGIVESPAGAWFVKATGPAATMEKHAASIREYLKSAHR